MPRPKYNEYTAIVGDAGFRQFTKTQLLTIVISYIINYIGYDNSDDIINEMKRELKILKENKIQE